MAPGAKGQRLRQPGSYTLISIANGQEIVAERCHYIQTLIFKLARS